MQSTRDSEKEEFGTQKAPWALFLLLTISVDKDMATTPPTQIDPLIKN